MVSNLCLAMAHKTYPHLNSCILFTRTIQIRVLKQRPSRITWICLSASNWKCRQHMMQTRYIKNAQEWTDSIQRTNCTAAHGRSKNHGCIGDRSVWTITIGCGIAIYFYRIQERCLCWKQATHNRKRGCLMLTAEHWMYQQELPRAKTLEASQHNSLMLQRPKQIKDTLAISPFFTPLHIWKHRLPAWRKTSESATENDDGIYFFKALSKRKAAGK